VKSPAGTSTSSFAFGAMRCDLSLITIEISTGYSFTTRTTPFGFTSTAPGTAVDGFSAVWAACGAPSVGLQVRDPVLEPLDVLHRAGVALKDLPSLSFRPLTNSVSFLTCRSSVSILSLAAERSSSACRGLVGPGPVRSGGPAA
jgi:hypothetical protein